MYEHLEHAAVAQSVEHILGKDEVGGSSPLSSSNQRLSAISLTGIADIFSLYRIERRLSFE